MQPRGERPIIISFRLEHLLGWGITTILCVIPLIMWLQIHPLSTIHGFPGIMLSIGRVTALIGMVMYALNLIYSTRLRFLESLFGGLNRVYIAHHLLGGLALVFLSLHPLFLSLRYVQTSLKQAALLLLPNGLTPLTALFDKSSAYHNIVLEQWAIFFGIIAFWVMVGLLLVTFFIKIPYRIWLFTHKFLGAAFFVAGLHVLFVSSDTSDHAALKYYMLIITGLGILAFVYKTLMGKIFIRRYLYMVDSITNEGGGVTHLTLLPQKGKMDYKPGQFIFIRFMNAGGDKISREWHPFSISSSPNDGKLRISVKALGDYTSRLSAIKYGTMAEIEGAYGKFTYTNFKNQNQVWIAGGIGVTPFISMASSLPEQSNYKIDLYYSVKTRSELIDWTKLAGVAVTKKDNFRVIPYIGDEQQGFLSADYIEKYSGELKAKEIFICGPPPMMQSMRKQLKSKSVPGTSIHSEEFAMS